MHTKLVFSPQLLMNAKNFLDQFLAESSLINTIDLKIFHELKNCNLIMDCFVEISSYVFINQERITIEIISEGVSTIFKKVMFDFKTKKYNIRAVCAFLMSVQLSLVDSQKIIHIFEQLLKYKEDSQLNIATFISFIVDSLSVVLPASLTECQKQQVYCNIFDLFSQHNYEVNRVGSQFLRSFLNTQYYYCHPLPVMILFNRLMVDEQLPLTQTLTQIERQLNFFLSVEQLIYLVMQDFYVNEKIITQLFIQLDSYEQYHLIFEKLLRTIKDQLTLNQVLLCFKIPSIIKNVVLKIIVFVNDIDNKLTFHQLGWLDVLIVALKIDDQINFNNLYTQFVYSTQLEDQQQKYSSSSIFHLLHQFQVNNIVVEQNILNNTIKLLLKTIIKLSSYNDQQLQKFFITIETFQSNLILLVQQQSEQSAKDFVMYLQSYVDNENVHQLFRCFCQIQQLLVATYHNINISVNSTFIECYKLVSTNILYQKYIINIFQKVRQALTVYYYCDIKTVELYHVFKQLDVNNKSKFQFKEVLPTNQLLLQNFYFNYLTQINDCKYFSVQANDEFNFDIIQCEWADYKVLVLTLYSWSNAIDFELNDQVDRALNVSQKAIKLFLSCSIAYYAGIQQFSSDTQLDDGLIFQNIQNQQYAVLNSQSSLSQQQFYDILQKDYSSSFSFIKLLLLFLANGQIMVKEMQILKSRLLIYESAQIQLESLLVRVQIRLNSLIQFFASSHEQFHILVRQYTSIKLSEFVHVKHSLNFGSFVAEFNYFVKIYIILLVFLEAKENQIIYYQPLFQFWIAQLFVSRCFDLESLPGLYNQLKYQSKFFISDKYSSIYLEKIFIDIQTSDSEFINTDNELITTYMCYLTDCESNFQLLFKMLFDDMPDQYNTNYIIVSAQLIQDLIGKLPLLLYKVIFQTDSYLKIGSTSKISLLLAHYNRFLTCEHEFHSCAIIISQQLFYIQQILQSRSLSVQTNLTNQQPVLIYQTDKFLLLILSYLNQNRTAQQYTLSSIINIYQFLEHKSIAEIIQLIEFENWSVLKKYKDFILTTKKSDKSNIISNDCEFQYYIIEKLCDIFNNNGYIIYKAIFQQLQEHLYQDIDFSRYFIQVLLAQNLESRLVQQISMFLRQFILFLLKKSKFAVFVNHIPLQQSNSEQFQPNVSQSYVNESFAVFRTILANEKQFSTLQILKLDILLTRQEKQIINYIQNDIADLKIYSTKSFYLVFLYLVASNQYSKAIVVGEQLFSIDKYLKFVPFDAHHDTQQIYSLLPSIYDDFINGVHISSEVNLYLQKISSQQRRFLFQNNQISISNPQFISSQLFSIEVDFSNYNLKFDLILPLINSEDQFQIIINNVLVIDIFGANSSKLDKSTIFIKNLERLSNTPGNRVLMINKISVSIIYFITHIDCNADVNSSQEFFSQLFKFLFAQLLTLDQNTLLHNCQLITSLWTNVGQYLQLPSIQTTAILIDLVEYIMINQKNFDNELHQIIMQFQPFQAQQMLNKILVQLQQIILLHKIQITDTHIIDILTVIAVKHFFHFNLHMRMFNFCAEKSSEQSAICQYLSSIVSKTPQAQKLKQYSTSFSQFFNDIYTQNKLSKPIFICVSTLEFINFSETIGGSDQYEKQCKDKFGVDAVEFRKKFTSKDSPMLFNFKPLNKAPISFILKKNAKNDQNVVQYLEEINYFIDQFTQFKFRPYCVQKVLIKSLQDDSANIFTIEFIKGEPLSDHNCIKQWREENVSSHSDLNRKQLSKLPMQDQIVEVRKFENEKIRSYIGYSLKETGSQMISEKQLIQANSTLQKHMNCVDSIACWSVITFLLYLGDRHGGNILFDEQNREIHYIDFECIFGMSATLPCPEMVAMRFTPLIQFLLGSTGLSGRFQDTSAKLIQLIKLHFNKFVNLFNYKKRDPVNEQYFLRSIANFTANDTFVRFMRAVDLSLDEVKLSCMFPGWGPFD